MEQPVAYEGTGARETKYLLCESDSGRMEFVECRGLGRSQTDEVYTDEHQFLLTLDGAFNWHLGSTTSLMDANEVLFIAPGDTSRDSHPVGGDVHALLVTPRTEFLEEAWTCSESALRDARGFVHRRAPASPELQRTAAAIAAVGRRASPETVLDMEEALIVLVGLVARDASASQSRYDVGRGFRLAEKAKQLLWDTEERMSLSELAAELGVSPTYLTDAFRRCVGMPLAQYHRRLRLARALMALPNTEDITTLALQLGFSSHAHFTSTFKAVFCQTPSNYRDAARRLSLATMIGA